jgi:peroxiredoxin
MKNTILTFFLLAAAAASLSAGPLSGRRVPSFTLPDMNATYHDILDYRGKVVVVEVMQTTCAHCQTMVPILEKVEQKYGNRVAILTIVVPPDNMDKVKDFATRFRITYPILFDCGQAAAALLKVTPENPKVDFPHLFLIDARGMIREDFDWVLDEATLTGNGLFESLDKLLSTAPAHAQAAPKAPAKGPGK